MSSATPKAAYSSTPPTNGATRVSGKQAGLPSKQRLSKTSRQTLSPLTQSQLDSRFNISNHGSGTGNRPSGSSKQQQFRSPLLGTPKNNSRSQNVTPIRQLRQASNNREACDYNSGTKAKFRNSTGDSPFNYSSKPASMDSPAYAQYLAKHYPDDNEQQSLPAGFDPESLVNSMTRLHIAQPVTPDKLRSIAKRLGDIHLKQCSPGSIGKSSRKLQSSSVSLLNSPNTWRNNKKTGDRASKFDRFIPNRNGDLESQKFQVSRASKADSAFTADPSKDSETLDVASFAYQSEVAKACGLALDTRILAFHEEPPVSDRAELRARYNRPIKQANNSAKASVKRKIPTMPEKVLDAPGIADDYYLNLLDWSSSNVLAVGLGNSLYLWNATSGSVNELFSMGDDDLVSSVSWCQDGTHIAIGDNNGDTHLWDVESGARVRVIRDHPTRVGTLAWNREIMSSGGREGTIHNHDVRIASSRQAVLSGHEGDICGLKWSPDGTQLASGGNDNAVNIWDARTSAARYTKREHTAAVKALAWCPWQSNLLATGGGSDDRKICFWNTATGARAARIDTGSQVTGILWSKTYRELVSSHGFTDNQLIVWKYPTMQKVVELPNAHQSRILHMAISPDGQTVCSGAADENLKFWKLFSFDGKTSKSKATGSSTLAAGCKKDQKGSPDFGGANIR